MRRGVAGPPPDAGGDRGDASCAPADGRGELRRYVLAGIAYVCLGVLVKQVLAWWSYGAVFLLLAVWKVPEWLARFRARRSR
jgi:hypothetical protein